MSGLLNKAKEAVNDVIHPGNKHNDTTTGATGVNSGVPEGAAGPHTSRVANAADPRVDSDLDNRAAHTHNHGTATTGVTGTGAGVGTTHGTNVGTGPVHNSSIANKLDPRVNTSSTTTGTTGTGYDGTSTTGNTHTISGTGTGVTPGTTGSTNAGPHSSNVLNKLDPRVDSNLDGSRNAGLNQTTNTTGHTPTVGGTGAGIGGTTHGSTNAGPHNSNLLNKADPRVDSDLDGGRHAGLNQTTNTAGHTHTHTHTTGTGVGGVGSTTHGSTNAGPHNSNLLNKADPRVDSDLDGGRHAGLNQTTHTTGQPSTVGGTSAGVGGTTGGSTNAGPHNSNLLNKLDPRVDSDLDGSKNAGLNQTTRTNY